MSGMSEFYKDNFFVIESESLKNIMPRLYGYILHGNEFYINSKKCNRIFPNDCYGCYINIVRQSDEIIICQDYFGSYGLYYYESNGFWAISNSFLYLIDYLKTNKKLSFNHEFAKTFLAAPQASLSFQETMVEEIKMLPKDIRVHINNKSGSILFETIVQEESCIDIDTKDAIDLIDSWHEKWNTMIKSIINNSKYMHTFGLSGGKDSRVTLACCLKPDVGCDVINFYSATDNQYTHSEDYLIAKKISSTYNFTLNKDIKLDRYRMGSEDNLNCSLLAKCGFHRELMPTHFWNKKPLFTLTGSGGDLRNLWNESAESFTEKMCKNTLFNSIDCISSLKESMILSKKQINTHLKLNSDLTAADYYYKHGRNRNHNGKANVEFFLSNKIILSPLMDSQLYKINQNIGLDNDKDLLYALIFHRYVPELLSIEFDSNRTIIKNTAEIAHYINDKYPLSLKKNDELKKINIDYCRSAPASKYDDYSALDVLKKIFYSEDVKKFTFDIFGEEAYNRADAYYKERSYHPYIAAAGLVESYYIYNICKNSRHSNNTGCVISKKDVLFSPFKPHNYNNNGFMKELFDFMQSARLDFKNYGSINNSVKIISSSDKKMYYSTPEWISDNYGSGMIIQSHSLTMNIIIEVIKTGELMIKLLGPWMKINASTDPLPIKIDFNKFVIIECETNKMIYSITNQTTVDSKHPHIIKLKCKDGQRLKMQIEWIPYTYGESEFKDLISKLYSKGIRDFLFWKKGQSE